jgi:hypothetical protein
MSTSPESGSSELGLDLDLHFLPAWAQKPAENKYARYDGTEEDAGRRRGDRGQRRDRGRDRPPRREEGRPGGQAPRRDRGPGGPGPQGREMGRPQSQERWRRPERAEPAPPPIEVNVSFIAEEKGVESLARQIRLTGRAYPLFDIAFLVLKKPERYTIRFSVIKKPDGQPLQPLFVCALDDTLWLSEQEALDYVLNKHFSLFYQEERTPTDPPKGTYTFVAQCGISGAILGPPNYHDYQNKIRKLHAERFSRMPFEMFKSRIKIVRDEAVVKKWLDDQSWRTEYICLNLPESLKLPNREEVQRHFREVHLANVIKSVESHSLSGPAAQALPSGALQRLVRRSWDDQMRFPLKVVNILSQQFAGHGLQFFKVNKTVTHVAVARPRYLDPEETPVSEGVLKIVEFIKATPNCTRRQILEALAPAPAPAQPSPTSEDSGQPAEQPSAEPAASPEMAAVISDLHWLIHQGHVIEFAKGLIELARKPTLKPPRPEPAKPTPQAAPPEETAADSTAEIPSEATTAHPEEAPAEISTAETAAPESSAAAASEPAPGTNPEPSEAPSPEAPSAAAPASEEPDRKHASSPEGIAPPTEETEPAATLPETAGEKREETAAS